jgi:hypothetical protein
MKRINSKEISFVFLYFTTIHEMNLRLRATCRTPCCSILENNRVKLYSILSRVKGLTRHCRDRSPATVASPHRPNKFAIKKPLTLKLPPTSCFVPDDSIASSCINGCIEARDCLRLALPGQSRILIHYSILATAAVSQNVTQTEVRISDPQPIANDPPLL